MALRGECVPYLVAKITILKIKHMTSINPYINFQRETPKKRSAFYKSVFGGEFATIIRFKDIATAEFPVSDAELNKIMRIALPIGGNFLFANDVPESMGRVSENENRSKIAVTAESKEEADKRFNWSFGRWDS